MENAEKWCSYIKNKYLLKKFIWVIYPSRLAKNLDILGYKKLSDVKAKFLRLFNQSYKARSTLVGNGGIDEEKKTAGSTTGDASMVIPFCPPVVYHALQ